MAGFADILAEVEAALRAAFAPPSRPPACLRPEIPNARDAEVSETIGQAQFVAAVYLRTIADESDAPPNGESRTRDDTKDIVARFPNDLAIARRSPEKLQALRRRLAWALHPDRAQRDTEEASRLMAHCNAMIDAELARRHPKKD